MREFEKVPDDDFKFIKSKFIKNYVKNFWPDELNRAYINGEYAVLVRTVNTEWGKIRHAAIRNIESTDICWSDKQEIKNKIFGEEKTAIEVFPAMSNLVDAANMYHLWIIPNDFKLPFNL